MKEKIRLPEAWQGWEITEYIGQGSYGSVYEAQCFSGDAGVPEQTAAVKVIRLPRDEQEAKSVAHEYAELNERRTFYQGIVNALRSEIHTMEQLKDNRNVVALQDYYIDYSEEPLSWTVYIRMELLTPFPEYQVMEVMEEADVIRLGIDICSALEDCEKKGIIHRDIKPENIMADSEGHFKLGDFGIARKMEESTKGLSLKGTFSYMAPEVYHGEKYDIRADQYSLGIVLYRLMNGNRDPLIPADVQMVSFREREEAVQKRMEGENLPDPEEASELFAKIIRKACAFRPEDRFESIALLKKALVSCLNGDTYTVTGLVDISEAERIRREKNRARNKKILLTAVIAGVLAAVLGTAIYFQTRKTEDEIRIEEARNTERMIEQEGVRKDNAFEETDLSEASDFQDRLNGTEEVKKVIDAIERCEENTQNRIGDGHKTAVFYLDDTAALGLSVNYKNIMDNNSNTEQTRSVYTLYYFTQKDGEWIRSDNSGIPGDLWQTVGENYLPEGYLEAEKAGRNCVSFPESFWVGSEAQFDSGAALRTAAVWQNEDGSADVYMICRNGTGETAAEYAWWLSLVDDPSGDILKAWGHLEPGYVTVDQKSTAGYIVHFSPQEVLTGTEEWDRTSLSVYTAGNNSHYDYSEEN